MIEQAYEFLDNLPIGLQQPLAETWNHDTIPLIHVVVLRSLDLRFYVKDGQWYKLDEETLFYEILYGYDRKVQ